MDKPPTDAEVAVALSTELKALVQYLDTSLDELANAAGKITTGLTALADVAGRIRRNIDDPPAERHALEIDPASHGQEAEIIGTRGEVPEPAPS